MKHRKAEIPGINTVLIVIGAVVGLIILANILGSTTGMVTSSIKHFNNSLTGANENLSGMMGKGAAPLVSIILYVFGFGAVLALIGIPIYMFFKDKGGF